MDHVRGGGLADAEVHERGHGRRVEYVAGVDECFGGGVGELGEAEDGLLGGDEGARCVDVEVAGEVGQGEREWVFCVVGGYGASFGELEG